LIGLAVLAPAALYRIGVNPYLQYRAGLADAVAAERDLLAREMALLADASGLRAEKNRVDAERETITPWLLSSQDDLEAEARLRRRVSQVGQDVRVLVQEVTSAAQDDRPGRVRTTAVAVRALGDLEGLVRMLHALENGTQLLHVEDLSIRPAGVNDGDLERGQLLLVSFVVAGYWWADEGAAQ